MSQISIKHAAHFPLEWQPKKVDPHILANAPMIEPEHYLDDEHYLSIYCPDCGVRCTRKPRKAAKRKDNVLAFFSHIQGYDEVSCQYRKPGNNMGTHGVQIEKKAANLLSFADWKDMDEDQGNHEENGEVSKPLRIVQGGRAGEGQRSKTVPNEDDRMLHAGEFHTVRRLVTVAFDCIDTYIKFPDREPERLGSLFIWIKNAQRNHVKYIGRSLIFFGRPNSIVIGRGYTFFNFKEHGHSLAMRCDHKVFEQLGWKTSERNFCYVFHGLLEPHDRDSFVHVMHLGQICRFSAQMVERLTSLHCV
jgi:hypothetical protein